MKTAMQTYDSASHPALPTSKAERRYLRKGLAERGDVLSTYGRVAYTDDEGGNRTKRVVLAPSDIGTRSSMKAGDKRIDDFNDTSWCDMEGEKEF